MPDLTLVAAISPILLCASVILFFRQNAIVGGLSGIALTVAIIVFNDGFQLNEKALIDVLSTTAILTLSAVLVIIPGLYLNATLRGQGILDDLVDWIQALPMSAENKVLILLLGLLPAIEALTGFGVSLFIGVPIFFRLFPSSQAYRLSLLGMSIMPWGTLALATMVGASLSGFTPNQLGPSTALTSSLVFPIFGMAGLYVVGQGPLLVRHGFKAVIIGCCLSLLLYVFNSVGLVETSGILAGALVAGLGFLLLHYPNANIASAVPTGSSTRYCKLWMFFPYALVLVLVLLTRTIEPVYAFISNAFVLKSAQTSLSVFASPGIVLALVCLLMLGIRPVCLNHKGIWSRSRVACLGLLFFIFLSQLMKASGMISTLAMSIIHYAEGTFALVLLAPLIGMFGGFITGSNLSGNALLMNVQQQLGDVSGQGLLFSAMQNSASGHAVFTSLPIIVLVMTIARDLDEDKHGGVTSVAEHELLRFGLVVGLFIYLALTAAFIVLNV